MSAPATCPDSGGRSPDTRRLKGIALRPQLFALGITPAMIEAKLQSLSWRRIGPSIVLHYGPLTRAQILQAALFAHGPHAVLASFTALVQHGLEGWERDEIQLLAPAGTALYQHPELPSIVLHHGQIAPHGSKRRVEPPASALVRAGASCLSERVACGVLASAVSQGVVRPATLQQRLSAHDGRHQRAMLAAAIDMLQADDALADLDLAQLCKKHLLPAPVSQRPRELAGRRRFVEVAWQLPDGHAFVVEVDGALHLAARRWWTEALRPSDLTVTSTGVLRIPSAVLRHEPEILLNVLRRTLSNHSATVAS